MRAAVIKFVFAVAAMVFIGCSDNDNNTPPETPRLVKQVEQTFYYDGFEDHFIKEFEYQNGVLTAMWENNQYLRTDFEYLGDKITKTRTYQGNTLAKETEFFYQGDVLQRTLDNDEYQNKIVYSYGNATMSSQNQYIINGIEGFGHTNDYKFGSGDVLEDVERGGINDPNPITKKYLYDNKNNPFKYANKYFRQHYLRYGLNGISANNVTHEYLTFSGGTPPDEVIYETTYDGNWPTYILRKRPDGSRISSTEITYY